MISVNNLSKYYNAKDKQIIVLKNVNIQFEYGKMYAIFGKNGSGKSTLLHILGLLDKQSNGIIKIDKDLISSNTSEEKKTKIRCQKIGFIFQKFYLDNNLRAYENVMIPMYMNSKIKKKEIKNNAIELLNSLNLKDKIYHYPNELSGGEQQRVAIARALANNPKIILADEPTGNLDKNNEKMVFSILKGLANNGCCIIVATHSETIKKYADEIINIDIIGEGLE